MSRSNRAGRPFSLEPLTCTPEEVDAYSDALGLRGKKRFPPAEVALDQVSTSAEPGRHIGMWLTHPDERVPEAVIRSQMALIGKRPSFHVTNVTALAQHRASQAGLVWTPLLDILDVRLAYGGGTSRVQLPGAPAPLEALYNGDWMCHVEAWLESERDARLLEEFALFHGYRPLATLARSARVWTPLLVERLIERAAHYGPMIAGNRHLSGAAIDALSAWVMQTHEDSTARLHAKAALSRLNERHGRGSDFLEQSLRQMLFGESDREHGAAAMSYLEKPELGRDVIVQILKGKDRDPLSQAGRANRLIEHPSLPADLVMEATRWVLRAGQERWFGKRLAEQRFSEEVLRAAASILKRRRSPVLGMLAQAPNCPTEVLVQVAQSGPDNETLRLLARHPRQPWRHPAVRDVMAKSRVHEVILAHARGASRDELPPLFRTLVRRRPEDAAALLSFEDGPDLTALTSGDFAPLLSHAESEIRQVAIRSLGRIAARAQDTPAPKPRRSRGR
jgi:hypothetical protein